MQITKQWNEKDNEYIRLNLLEYNKRFVPAKNQLPLQNISFVVRNDDGKIVGGVMGKMFWQCMQIDILWVDEAVRGQGYGAKLVRQMEEVAVENECSVILLDTFSFQAPGFYKKQGFTVVGIVEDHPAGHDRYYLEKRLPSLRNRRSIEEEEVKG